MGLIWERTQRRNRLEDGIFTAFAGALIDAESEYDDYDANFLRQLWKYVSDQIDKVPGEPKDAASSAQNPDTNPADDGTE